MLGVASTLHGQMTSQRNRENLPSKFIRDKESKTEDPHLSGLRITTRLIKIATRVKVLKKKEKETLTATLFNQVNANKSILYKAENA